MTILAGSSTKKMSSARGQSSGWAAFDLKQRKKNNLESDADKDPFPALGTSSSMQHVDNKLAKKNRVPLKPFSSVILPAKNFPPLKEGGHSKKTMLVFDSTEKCHGNTVQGDVNLATKKLKEQHLWADNSLIEDILAAVNNNVNKASALLETMVSVVNFEDSNEDSNISSDPRSTTLDDITDESLTLGNVKHDFPFRSNLVGHLQDNDEDSEVRNTSSDQMFSGADNLRCKMNILYSVPVEPEWEDDDVYNSHRKDALRTMRSASRHSRAAAGAFLRGDHYAAQQHSMRAREEWHTADKLNTEAATKILSIRNNENDIWKLDLHGLHAAEAIQALQEHLYRIESQGFPKNSATAIVKDNWLAHSTLGSLNVMNRENLDKQVPLRLRSLALHVITGIGNHSRGQAALPSAVKSFLTENRYRFEETRPGAITVWPKFRQS